MAQFKDMPDEQKPLCFFDGSFIVSFAGQLKPNLAAPYLGAIGKLLDCSKRYRVPIVGFVDGPHSRDIAKLIENTLTVRKPATGLSAASESTASESTASESTASESTANESTANAIVEDKGIGGLAGGEQGESESKHSGVSSKTAPQELYPKVGSHDAELLAPRLPYNQWGVRSPLFICAREDALTTTDQSKGEDRASFYKTVAFTYLRLNQNRTPARIEIPRWLVDEGRTEEIIDLVRAECIVGVGYPYAIETADALAVISHRDRQRFYTLVQQSYPDFNLTPARKVASKLARR